MMKKIGIIGGGNWGTALAVVLAKQGHAVKLWAYEKEVVESINRIHENCLFLESYEIPENVVATDSIETAVQGAEIVIGVMPSHHARRLYTQIIPLLRDGTVFVSATKGIEEDSLERMSQVFAAVAQGRAGVRFAALSGPTFAREIARGDPAAVVIASQHAEAAEMVQKEFSSRQLRLYRNSDLVGVELGGSVKNVIAIAAGVCDGLGLGSNSIAALITRGLAEMTRLVVASGGKRETMAGLAGLGDLVLTCTGSLSRNRTVGTELGQGKKLAEIMSGTRMVAEGVRTTQATLSLARKMQVEMPIVEQMHALLYEDRTPMQAIHQLMDRSLKPE
ncbi:MAG: NAD(P)-dependent glycerol-3-phosphate dehydrogenase [Acidobacteriia bacterium]|nr:NAD(P)-dependent glycerol-3-phosphate dehydrogenase [Terriglobia bacterium]